MTTSQHVPSDGCPWCSYPAGNPCWHERDGYGRCYRKREGVWWVYAACAFVFLLAMTLAYCAKAETREMGVPDLDQWYEGLKVPFGTANCCGWGDAYFADKVDNCGPKDGTGDNCVFVAIITDTRPDTFTTPSGKKITRPHVAPGTRIAIPKSALYDKTNMPTNPTGHNVIFLNLNEYSFGVICWVQDTLA